jgi:hypothetical protein
LGVLCFQVISFMDALIFLLSITNEVEHLTMYLSHVQGSPSVNCLAYL